MAVAPAFRTNLQAHIDWFTQNRDNLAVTQAACFDFVKVGIIFEARGPFEFGSLAGLRAICSKAAAGMPLSTEIKVPRQKMQAAKGQPIGGAPSHGDIEDIGVAKGRGNGKGKRATKNASAPGKGTSGASKGNNENISNNTNNNSNARYQNQQQPSSMNQYQNQQQYSVGGSSGSTCVPPSPFQAQRNNSYCGVQDQRPMNSLSGGQQPYLRNDAPQNQHQQPYFANNVPQNQQQQQPYLTNSISQNQQQQQQPYIPNNVPHNQHQPRQMYNPPEKRQRVGGGNVQPIAGVQPATGSAPATLSMQPAAESVFQLCQPFWGTGPRVELDVSFFGEQHSWNRPFEWDTQVRGAMFQIFGIPQFRHMQREIINASLSNKDVFVRMPTGGGKSLTYQLPPVINSRLAICISPLISLMMDQVMSMDELGVPCGVLRGNSDTSVNENNDTYRRLQNRELLLLYVTPEMLSRSGKLQRVLEDMGDYVGRFVIDEAHCLSQWGYDFRESYLELRKLRNLFPTVPILACSATATDQVMDDVARTLHMQNAQIFKTTLNRPNLQYFVLPKKKLKVLDQIVDFIKSTWKHRVPSGIIYCLSRRECEKVAEELKKTHRLNAAFYHAEATAEYRQNVQMRWMRNEIPIIVSTVAFGMGINKPDVEFVIHQTMPKTLEGYYQESGRAGRNGVKSICVIFYDYSDKTRHENMLKSDVPAQKERLLDMVKYCDTVHLCRRTLLEQYFDVNGASDVVCREGMEVCDNCAASLNYNWDAYDVTLEARCVVQLVTAVSDNKQRGLTLLVLKDVLIGSKAARVKNFLRYPHAGRYAKGQRAAFTDEEITRFLRHLICIKVLDEELFVPQGVGHAAPIAYIIVGPNFNHAPIYFPRKKPKVQQQQKQQPVVLQKQMNGLTQAQAGELKRRLKMLVDDISQREGRNTSMGCISQLGIDRLVEADQLPRDLQELSMCKTFNVQRVRDYGHQVLECLRQFLLDFNIEHLAAPNMHMQSDVTVTNLNAGTIQ
eukprot:GEMP01002305.1.p1 GENE.GEMP01002305.1~~GEMP01002305.1.p1  ORF type:complete len:1007 (+),score=171.93 GEMP01002305.1:181-3201(+)